MSVLSVDYTDCKVLIYDMNGNHLVNTVITAHDKNGKQIELLYMPERLKACGECRLMIMTSPAPCEYTGMVKRVGAMYSIALFQGHVKESRAATRYKVNSPAVINHYVSKGQQYELFSPVNITLLNISTGGARIRAPYNTLSMGDIFRFDVDLSGSRKTMVAEVMNHFDNEQQSSDYGCRFVASDIPETDGPETTHE